MPCGALVLPGMCDLLDSILHITPNEGITDFCAGIFLLKITKMAFSFCNHFVFLFLALMDILSTHLSTLMIAWAL